MSSTGLTSGIWEEREKLKEGRNWSDGWESWAGAEGRSRRGDERADATATWDRNRLKTEKRAEGGKCGKSIRRMGMVMRRVYQLFRCRLLIKHHQTLNLLTINALIHYLPLSPQFLPFISHSSLLFPSGFGSASPFLSSSLPLSVSLYQTAPTQARLTI